MVDIVCVGLQTEETYRLTKELADSLKDYVDNRQSIPHALLEDSEALKRIPLPKDAPPSKSSSPQPSPNRNGKEIWFPW